MDQDKRPWGKYTVIKEDEMFKIKKIEVNPGQRLSYQYHRFRAETWVIIQGNTLITIEGINKEYTNGDTIEIFKGAKHRIQNTGKNKLIFIEVQTGTYFGEDDIIRIDDDYKRN